MNSTDQLISFLGCIDCPQGIENLTMERVDDDMTKQPGKIMVETSNSDAAESTDMAASKAKQSKICQECNQRPTIHPNSNLCASCMARRSNVNRKDHTASSTDHLPEKQPVTFPDRRTFNFDALKALILDDKSLIENIIQASALETRPPEYQILHMIREGLELRKRAHSG